MVRNDDMQQPNLALRDAGSNGAWPAVGYEKLPWVSQYRPGIAVWAQMQRQQRPYRAAVVPPIADLTPRLPAKVLTEAEDASREIARFDAFMGGENAPFGAALLRSESAASSQLENLTASAYDVAEAEILDAGRLDAVQIVANIRAMEVAVDLADRLGSEAILAMHRVLMETTELAIAGRWREEQVWIGGGPLGPHKALFVPPHHSRVAPAVDDLVAFMRRDDLPVLIQAAIAHAQFETIHPFPAGNCRTSRSLLHAVLRAKSLVRNAVVPVSAGLLADPDAYFAALTAYRGGDPAPIVGQVSAAAIAAIANGRALVTELGEIRVDWGTRIKSRRNATSWRVADHLLRNPAINAHVVTGEFGVAKNKVYPVIAPLLQAGVLAEFTARRRHRAWWSTEVLAALDAFAARAGARGSDSV